MLKGIFIFLLSLILLNQGLAFSIGVSPDKIYLDLNNSESQILLVNPNQYPVKCKIQAAAPWLFLSETELEILPKETSRVRIGLLSGLKDGLYSEIITVFAAPLQEDALSVSPGVAVKVEATVANKVNNNLNKNTNNLNKISSAKRVKPLSALKNTQAGMQAILKNALLIIAGFGIVYLCYRKLGQYLRHIQ